MKFCFYKKEFIEQDIEFNKLAVVGEDFNLTWSEFASKVNSFISFLEKNKIDKIKSPVVIYGHKSANMLVTIYAMMKLEITYIPVDIIYPKERVRNILNAVDGRLLINTSSLDLKDLKVNEVSLTPDKMTFHKVSMLEESFERELDPIVYIIFTSGSTGEPKGVQISSEAIQSFTGWMGSSDFKFSKKDVFINTALLSFDLSVFEVMTFGFLGSTIILNSSEQSSNPLLMMDRIEKYKGSVWISTPSFALTYARIKDNFNLKSIHTFLFCGEVLPVTLTRKLFQNYNTARVINTYGPTEATVATTVIEVTKEILEKFDPLPVGKVKEGSEIIIDDKEIIIVGPNVSIGYVGNRDLNQRKFLEINGQRAFRTGDLGFIENDLLYFYGRNDDLVKLHGYRIELSEITNVLSNLKGVLYAETIPLKRNEITKKIISFLHLDKNDSRLAKDFKEELSKFLPHYMIPAEIILLEELPLNQNGKVDKKLLMSKL